MFGIFDKEYQLTLMLEEERQEGWKEGWTEGWKEGWKEGWAEGREEGREENRITSIKNLMSTLKLTAQQAMDALMIPASEQERYLELL